METVIKGSVNFPYDKEYSFNYYKNDETIYWDGDKGTTFNIWRSAKCVETGCSKLQYSDQATINLKDSTLTLKWSGNRQDASGTINGGDISGKVYFPDDREYSFNFYKDEEKIYWNGDKGTTMNTFGNLRSA